MPHLTLIKGGSNSPIGKQFGDTLPLGKRVETAGPKSNVRERHTGIKPTDRTLVEFLSCRDGIESMSYRRHLTLQADDSHSGDSFLLSDQLPDNLSADLSRAFDELDSLLQGFRETQSSQMARSQNKTADLQGIRHIDELDDGEVVTLHGGLGSVLAIFQRKNDGHHFMIFDLALGMKRYALQHGFTIYAKR